jgi:uncharacterized protein DUF4339
MPDQVWYLFQDGVQQGPMTLEALRVLADQGKLNADSLVTRVGMTDWVPARSLPELFPQEAAIVRPPLPPGVGPRRDYLAWGRGLGDRMRRTFGGDIVETLPHLRAVRALLELLRRRLTETALVAADRLALQTGHLAYLVAAAFLVLAFLILGIRGDSAKLVFIGLLIIGPAAVVLHFLAVLFLDAGPALLRKSPSELSSSVPLAFFALAFLAGAVYCFLVGLYSLFRGGAFLDFALWMGGFLVLLYACALAVNPQTVNVAAGADLTAGEEALGLAMFLVKLPVRLVPFLFGVGSVVGLGAAVFLFFLTFRDQPLYVTAEAYPIAASVLLALGLLPFAVYVGFSLAFLAVDVLRAILRIPARIDALRQDVNGR